MAKKPANAGRAPEFQIRDRDRADNDGPRGWDDILAEADEADFAGEDADDLKEAKDKPPFGDDTSREIITLLAQIGRRLHRNEAERQAIKQTLNDYRRLMEGIENRSEQSEKIFLTLQDKLSKQESADDSLRRRQKELEDRQEAQAERIEKAAAMADRIEEAMAQHERLNRRMEKIAQDKARFLRKLERIEESVIETRAALNSKAMVLLADQNAVSQKPLLSLGKPDTDEVFTAPARERWPDLWSRRHAASIALLAAFGILLGLGVAGYYQWTALNAAPGAATLALTSPQAGDTTDTNGAPRSSIDNAGLQAVPHFEQTPVPSAATSAAPSAALPDAEHMTDAEKNAAFDKDPDALAAALNAIEPSDPKAAAVPDASEPPPLPPQAYAMDKAAKTDAKTGAKTPPEKVAMLTPPAAAKASTDSTAHDAVDLAPPAAASAVDDDFDTAAFLKAQTPSGTLSARIQPDPNLPKTVKAVEAQAFKGVPEAQHDLAAIYTAGKGGVSVDYAKAAAWFRESAVNGVPNAQYNLGVLYHQGLGVPQNTDLAIDWYRAAASRHHPEAEYNLGIANIEGMGTHYDPKRAAAYFRDAARQGVMEASYNLGLIYENGLLGRSQSDQALYWYRTAADQGSPEGRAAMNQLAHSLHYSPADVDRVYNRIKASEKAAGNSVTVQDVPMKAMAKLGDAAPAATDGGDEADDARPIPLSNAEPSGATPDHAVVAQIQEQLMRLGLYPGPADGVDNALTDDAIRSYQRLSSLPQDGRASQALLVNLLSSELGASVKAQAAQSLRAEDREIPGGT
jgi:TPR repeat protein